MILLLGGMVVWQTDSITENAYVGGTTRMNLIVMFYVEHCC